MYKLGKKHHKKHGKLVFGLLILLLGGATYVLKDFHPQTTATIKNSAAVVTRYDGESAKKLHFDETNYSIDLPAGWRLVSHDTASYNLWTFQGTTGDDRNRIIGIYEDNIPVNMAVNRMLALQNVNNELSHDNAVSDNCLNYTSAAEQSTPQAVRTKIVTDKWQGVSFYCDIGNYLRNVTGTSSAQGINSISLTGKTSGAHKLYFTFTDATISPDYSAFYNMLDSFKLK
jgi:hypothetical protein